MKGETASPILARHQVRPDPVLGWTTLVWVQDRGTPRERVLVRSQAIRAAGKAMGGPWAALARFGALIPRAWLDAAYDAVSLRRQRLGEGAACRLPRSGAARAVARFVRRQE